MVNERGPFILAISETICGCALVNQYEIEITSTKTAKVS